MTENDNGGASTIMSRFGSHIDTFELGIDGTNLLAQSKHSANNLGCRVKEMNTSTTRGKDSRDSIGNANKSLIEVIANDNATSEKRNTKKDKAKIIYNTQIQQRQKNVT